MATSAEAWREAREALETLLTLDTDDDWDTIYSLARTVVVKVDLARGREVIEGS